jgi:hypothetical protein
MQMHANGAIGFERKYLLAPLQIPLTRLFESKSSAEPPRHHHPDAETLDRTLGRDRRDVVRRPLAGSCINDFVA